MYSSNIQKNQDINAQRFNIISPILTTTAKYSPFWTNIDFLQFLHYSKEERLTNHGQQSKYGPPSVFYKPKAKSGVYIFYWLQKVKRKIMSWCMKIM